MLVNKYARVQLALGNQGGNLNFSESRRSKYLVCLQFIFKFHFRPLGETNLS